MSNQEVDSKKLRDIKYSQQYEDDVKQNEKYMNSFIKNAENIMKDRNEKLVEDMSKEELKVLFQDYDIEHNYEEDLTNFDSENIEKILHKTFDDSIIKLYCHIRLNNPDLKWYELVRKFINWHNDNKYCNLTTLYNMNPYIYFHRITSSKEEINKIKKDSFQMFISEDCADISEDEIKSLNNLTNEEWKNVDDIILYYYYHNI